MPHAISLTDGTTTVNLYNLAGAFPTSWRLAAGEEGDETVGEALDLLIQGASVTALQAAVRDIEKLLEAAVRRERTRVGARVFLQVKWDGEADTWRSEVVGGRLELHGAAEQYGRLKIEASLGLTRRAWWEGPEAQLPLSNGNGTNNTAGLDLFNCNDGSGSSPNKRHNYAQIAAADVVGSLPAPVKVELANSTGLTMFLTNIHLANNVFSDPESLGHMLEAESRVWGGTVTADAACSGGSKVVFSSYAGQAQIYWSLNAAVLQKTAGRWFRLLLAVRSRTATALETVQAELRDPTDAVVLHSGPEVALNRPATLGYPLVDMGAFPLPPGPSSTAYERVRLWLTFRVAEGTATTAIDYIQLTPTDSYRPLRLQPIGILANDVLVDDGIEGLSYATANGFRGPFLRGKGDPLLVWPGRTQRIYVQADDDGFPPSITDRWKMRAWYRPRRKSL